MANSCNMNSSSVDSIFDEFNLDKVDISSFDGFLDNILREQQTLVNQDLIHYTEGNLSPGASSSSSDSGCQSAGHTDYSQCDLDILYHSHSNGSHSPSSTVSFNSSYTASATSGQSDSERLTPPAIQSPESPECSSSSSSSSLSSIQLPVTLQPTLGFVTVPALLPTQILVPADSLSTGNIPAESQTCRINYRDRATIRSNSISSSDSNLISAMSLPLNSISSTLSKVNALDSSHLSKSEARKLRNRQSATNSRMKQKLEVESLKKENSQLKIENTTLRNEIKKLTDRLVDIEVSLRKKASSCPDCSSPSSSMSFGSKRKAISLLAVCFMISFNLSSPIYQYLGSQVQSSGSMDDSPLVVAQNSGLTRQARSPLGPKLNSQMKKAHEYSIGRSLLWQRFDFSSSDDENQNASSQIIATNSSFNVTPGCAEMYINSSESLRLDSELRGWVQRVESKQKQLHNDWSKFTGSHSGYPFGNHNRPLPLARLGSLEPHDGLTLDQLIRSIDRKEDTYYFVSLLTTGDPYLLLPPTSRSNHTVDGSSRPRVSFIMPALRSSNRSKVSTNGHNNSSFIASPATSNGGTLIQIDCEVMNTQFILVKSLRGNSIDRNGRLHPNHKFKSTSPKVNITTRQAVSNKTKTIAMKSDVNSTD